MAEPIKINTWYEWPATNEGGYSVDIQVVEEVNGVETVKWEKTVTVPAIPGEVVLRQSIWRK